MFLASDRASYTCWCRRLLIKAVLGLCKLWHWVRHDFGSDAKSDLCMCLLCPRIPCVLSHEPLDSKGGAGALWQANSAFRKAFTQDWVRTPEAGCMGLVDHTSKHS